MMESYREIQKTYWMDVAQSNPNCKEKAMNILQDLLSKYFTKDYKKNIHLNVVAATIHLNAGILHVEMEDTEFATECYKKCINLLKNDKLTSAGILPAISANNQLSLIYAQQDLYEEAKDFLEQAEDLYIKFTEDVKLDPVIVLAIIGIKEIEEDRAENILEKLHISTLYLLAQVYRNLDNKYGSAPYTHKVQSKQLNQNRITQDKIMQNYAKWALNATAISQHFIKQDKFPQARHYLAVTSYILKKYLKTLKAKGTKETSESIAAEYEHYDKTSANVAKYWVRYGIALLKSSEERLTKQAGQDEDSKLAEAFDEIYKYFQTETMEDSKFVDLKSELESIANEITDKYLLDFNSAKLVFLNIQKWLNKAKEYYTFENHTSDYTWIAQNFSQAYKYLTLFEDNQDRQARMHKRRIDTLEEVIKRLCPRDYQIICREIWLELAETYSEILDLKIDRLQASNERPTAHMIAKIERLAKNSIKHCQSYLNSLEMSKSKNGVESFSDDSLYPALYIHFHIGRFYDKIITYDLQQKVEYMQNSVDAYSFVVNYYNKHPEKQEDLEKYEWVKSSKEFLTWLPNSLERFKQQINYTGQHGKTFYDPFVQKKVVYQLRHKTAAHF